MNHRMVPTISATHTGTEFRCTIRDSGRFPLTFNPLPNIHSSLLVSSSSSYAPSIIGRKCDRCSFKVLGGTGDYKYSQTTSYGHKKDLLPRYTLRRNIFFTLDLARSKTSSTRSVPRLLTVCFRWFLNLLTILVPSAISCLEKPALRSFLSRCVLSKISSRL